MCDTGLRRSYYEGEISAASCGGQLLAALYGADGEDYVKPISINETGARIWQGLQENYTKEQIAEEFHRRFDISVAEAMEDIEQFVDQLEKQGIVILTE